MPYPISSAMMAAHNDAAAADAPAPMAESDSALSDIVKSTGNTLPDVNTGLPQFYPAHFFPDAAPFSPSSISPRPYAPAFVSTPVSAPVPVAQSPAEGSSLIPTPVHLAAWKKFASKYRDARPQRHLWEWVDLGKGRIYLPFYEYHLVAKITDLWTEWVTGLNGYVSTRELEEEWGPSWRRSQKGL
ncbi:hypothetical protein C8J57DRAFT_1507642 [Mycena rebaudengoi]|nr:hypothetical protein C8J57DRAFT_1507642 [Mycena rebaudengoi]